MNDAPKFQNRDQVVYQDRLYTIASTKLGDIGGPHYRLTADGDYPGEDLTAEALLRRAPWAARRPNKPVT